MEPFFKQLSIALGLLTSDNSTIANVDGWQNYVWRVRPIHQCIQMTAREMCMLVDDKWDWKRDQHYSFATKLDAATNTINSNLRLDNRDPSDDDNVCIVAIFTDQKGEQVAVFYQNWRSLHGRTISRDVPVKPSKPVETIAQVSVGSKQCDARAANDADNFYKIRLALNQR